MFRVMFPSLSDCVSGYIAIFVRVLNMLVVREPDTESTHQCPGGECISVYEIVVVVGCSRCHRIDEVRFETEELYASLRLHPRTLDPSDTASIARTAPGSQRTTRLTGRTSEQRERGTYTARVRVIATNSESWRRNKE